MASKCPRLAFMDDFIGEILLRIPPDEPKCLVRASVVCKPWRQFLIGPTFLRHFREFHRTPPLLGFLCNERVPDITRFVPTTTASPSPNHHWHLTATFGGHSTATMAASSFAPSSLRVSSSGTPSPGTSSAASADTPTLLLRWAVLCAVHGCDHLNCHGQPFLVVFVRPDDDDDATWASVYSSEIGEWGMPTSVEVDSNVEMVPSLLIGDAVYFMCEYGTCILGYDMGRHELSVTDLPPELDGVMTVVDGRLGLVGVDDYKLYLWSWQAGPGDDNGWTQRRVIELETMLPVGVTSAKLGVIGIVEGTDVIFLSTDVGVFKIELNSSRVVKVDVCGPCSTIVPYMSFYTPDLARIQQINIASEK